MAGKENNLIHVKASGLMCSFCTMSVEEALGLPLHEIREVLGLAALGTSPCGHVQSALAQKLTEVDRRLVEMHTFRDELATLIARSSDLTTGFKAAQVCAIVEDAPMPVTRTDIAVAPLASRRSARCRT